MLFAHSDPLSHTILSLTVKPCLSLIFFASLQVLARTTFSLAPLFFLWGADPCRPHTQPSLHSVFAGGRPPSPLPLLGRPSGIPTPCTRSRLCAWWAGGNMGHRCASFECGVEKGGRKPRLFFSPFDGPSRSDVFLFGTHILCEGRRKGLVRRGRRRSRGEVEKDFFLLSSRPSSGSTATPLWILRWSNKKKKASFPFFVL